mgnify:CR=1 FL=1
MSFLSPLLFLGLATLAVPVLVHLIQRERKRVIEFPSLMFVQKIPYQSVRRRRIRHWPLLLMRALEPVICPLKLLLPSQLSASGGLKNEEPPRMRSSPPALGFCAIVWMLSKVPADLPVRAPVGESRKVLPVSPTKNTFGVLPMPMAAPRRLAWDELLIWVQVVPVSWRMVPPSPATLMVLPPSRPAAARRFAVTVSGGCFCHFMPSQSSAVPPSPTMRM